MPHMRTIAFLFPLLIACGPSTPPDTFRDAITEELKALSNDPQSFEYVQTIAVDTVTAGEFRSRLLQNALRNLPIDSAKYSAEADSLGQALTLPDTADVIRVNVRCQIRSKNKLGALVLETYSIGLAPDMTVVAVSDPL